MSKNSHTFLFYNKNILLLKEGHNWDAVCCKQTVALSSIVHHPLSFLSFLLTCPVTRIYYTCILFGPLPHLATYKCPVWTAGVGLLRKRGRTILRHTFCCKHTIALSSIMYLSGHCLSYHSLTPCHNDLHALSSFSSISFSHLQMPCMWERERTSLRHTFCHEQTVALSSIVYLSGHCLSLSPLTILSHWITSVSSFSFISFSNLHMPCL